MNKKILIGSIIAVVLLTLVSFSSVVGYSNVKSNPSNTIITDEYDNATPIQLVFQLIAKLRNHPNIQNVESEDDVLQIIESDEELNSIYEQLSNNDDDCGCEDDSSTLEWRFPVICMLLFPIFVLGLIVYMMGQNDLILVIVLVLGMPLNCRWIP